MLRVMTVTGLPLPGAGAATAGMAVTAQPARAPTAAAIHRVHRERSFICSPPETRDTSGWNVTPSPKRRTGSKSAGRWLRRWPAPPQRGVGAQGSDVLRPPPARAGVGYARQGNEAGA